MQTIRRSLASTLLGLLASALFISMTIMPAASQSETVLHNFPGVGNLAVPGLVFDTAGNLYGVIPNNATSNMGQVFELSPAVGGGWTVKLLYTFAHHGDYESFSSLIFDTAGNLYGTTSQGGPDNCGTVYELSPTAAGAWTAKALHNFANNSKDGCTPLAGLMFDSAGNLYGTTQQGGTHGVGVVFKLAPQAGGHWSEEILHTFGIVMDGEYPQASLTMDSAGNLYGTTYSGGGDESGDGTVFELSPHAGSSWTETILFNFTTTGGAYGSGPLGGVVFDAAGNLYGTTDTNGDGGEGTVYELLPSGGGWDIKILLSCGGGNGAFPQGKVVLDAAGNVYGTTYAGGMGSPGNGLVYMLSDPGGGPWDETILWTFNGHDGQGPASGVILDAAGNLYGMTGDGGAGKGGVAFEITP
jgi:uncharacterized repeat protein (TIGR03803 family)